MSVKPQCTLDQGLSGPIPEIVDILAAGLMRALARKSSHISQAVEESSLDILLGKSGHPTRKDGRIADD